MLAAMLGLGWALFVAARLGMALVFEWPRPTLQCGVYPLTFDAGTPPYTITVLPLKLQPFVFSPNFTQNSTDPASALQAWQWPISLQMPFGEYYSLIISDATGFASYGALVVQAVQNSGNVSCLDTALSNKTDKEFVFTASGDIVECAQSFHLEWDGPILDAPYNFSVIPLDGGYHPFVVPITDLNATGYDWTVNLTTGSFFTVMMNNKNGYGHGGIGGVYQVQNGSDSGCATQTRSVAGFVLPSGLTVDLPSSTSTSTSTSSAAPATGSTGGGNLDDGTIAGIVIGAIAGVAIIGFLLFWWIRRRRRRNRERARKLSMDIIGEGKPHGHADPHLEPFISPLSTAAPSRSPPDQTPRNDLVPSESVAAVSTGDTPSPEWARSSPEPVRSSPETVRSPRSTEDQMGYFPPLPSKERVQSPVPSPPPAENPDRRPRRPESPERPSSGTSNSVNSDERTKGRRRPGREGGEPLSGAAALEADLARTFGWEGYDESNPREAEGQVEYEQHVDAGPAPAELSPRSMRVELPPRYSISMFQGQRSATS